MRYTHTRAAWVDPRYPVAGPLFQWALIEWIVIHYTGADDLIDGDPGEHAADLPGYLRQIHRNYLNRQPSGYSIGYSVAVDWLGGTWELRGDTFKAAANADREDTIESPHDRPGDENARTFAVLVLVDGQDEATPQAAAAIRDLVAQVRVRRPNAVVLGHRDVDKTQCPGAGLYSQINTGTFETVATPPEEDDDEEDDEMLVTDKTLASITSAPPPLAQRPAGMDEATWSRWFQQALLKAFLIVNTTSDEYDQDAALALNAILQRRD